MSDTNLIYQAKMELLQRCLRINDIPREFPEILKEKYDLQWKKFINTVESIKCKFINNNEPYSSLDNDYIQALNTLRYDVLFD